MAGSWGGARTGAGRPRKSLAQHRRQGTRPNYDVKPPREQTVSASSTTWPSGFGSGPDIAAMLAAVDDAWNPELEAAWAPQLEAPWNEPRHGNRPSEARIVARFAVSDWLRQWRRECGPEHCAGAGVPADVILEVFGRPARPKTKVFPPPDADDVREALIDGWILKYWRREV